MKKKEQTDGLGTMGTIENSKHFGRKDVKVSSTIEVTFSEQVIFKFSDVLKRCTGLWHRF